MQPVLQVLFNKKILLVSWAVVAYRITFSSSSSPSPDTSFDAWNRNVFPLQFCVFHEAWSLVGSHLLRAHSCERHANMSLLIALWAVFVFLEGVGDPHPHGPVWFVVYHFRRPSSALHNSEQPHKVLSSMLKAITLLLLLAIKRRCRVFLCVLILYTAAKLGNALLK